MRSSTGMVVVVALAFLSSAGRAKPPAVVVAKTSDADLVLRVRLLLARRAAKDPIKLAIHVSGPGGPLDPARKPGAERIDLVKTLASLTFELIAPDGKTHRLQADVRDDRTKWQKERSVLARNATWVMDVTAEGFRFRCAADASVVPWPVSSGRVWSGNQATARPDKTGHGTTGVRHATGVRGRHRLRGFHQRDCQYAWSTAYTLMGSLARSKFAGKTPYRCISRTYS